MNELTEDDDMMAAEYALRLLVGDELQQANARLAADPAFADAVQAWAVRLASIADDLPDEVPGPQAKRALMQRLFPAPPKQSIWERTRIWQGISLTALVLAAGLAWQVTMPTGPANGPLYAAQIEAVAGDFRVVAVVDKRTNEITLTRTTGEAPEGRILQVWAHGEGEPATSVGLWPVGATVRLPFPAEIAAVEGILTIGVSEEPPGGSTTGSPSGRVFGTVDIPGVRTEN